MGILIASSGVLRLGQESSLRYAKKKFCESIELRTIESIVSQILVIQGLLLVTKCVGGIVVSKHYDVIV